MSAVKFNLNNPAVKRILQEVKEMQNNPSDDYMSLPLEDNIFEWQFAIRGPRDTEFEGGIYHGRIQLPAEYPLKPPAFMLLTPNGRFETQTKICLSISQYHPEHWQPSWSVRTALVALIAFMPTKGNGAIGSLDFTKEERMALALKSVETPPKYGNAERQRLIDEIHAEMIKRAGQVPKESDKDDVSDANKEKQKFTEGRVESSPTEEVCVDKPAISPAQVDDNNTLDTQPGNTEEVTDGNISTIESRPAIASSTEPKTVVSPARGRPSTRQQASDDYFLTSLAIGLMVAIVVLMIKKFCHSFSWVSFK